MDYGNGRRRRVVLLGHSYIRRLRQYIQDNRLQNLLLSEVDLVVQGYGGATITQLRQRLCSNLVDRADVVFLHIGENDYEGQQPIDAARSIVALAMDLIHMYRVRCVVVSQLVRFPVHVTDWTIRVNQQLQRLIARLEPRNIRLWRQRRGFYNHRSRLFDCRGVHVDPTFMRVYYNAVRRAVLSAMRYQH